MSTRSRRIKSKATFIPKPKPAICIGIDTPPEKSEYDSCKIVKGLVTFLGRDEEGLPKRIEKQGWAEIKKKGRMAKSYFTNGREERYTMTSWTFYPTR